MADFAPIEKQLARLGQRLAYRRAFEGMSMGLGIAGFCLGLAAWIANTGNLLFAQILCCTGGGGFLLAMVWQLFGRHRAYAFGSRMGQARFAETLAPKLGSAVSSAVSFQSEPRPCHQGISASLVTAHLRSTARSLETIDLKQHLREYQKRQLRIHIGCGILGLFWATGMLLGFDGGAQRLMGSMLHPGASAVSDVPLAGDLMITYAYPAYTGLPPKIIEGGDGSISAIAGTLVRIRATTDTPPQAAFFNMRHTHDESAARTIQMEVDGRHISTQFTLLRNGRYYFSLTDEDHERIDDPIHHPIVVQPDAFPTVFLDAPTGDVTLRNDQGISLLWRAQDDFGVGTVHLVIESTGVGLDASDQSIENKQQKIALGDTHGHIKRREGRYLLTLGHLTVAKHHGARLYLEAFDNDAIDGPKRSVSASINLVVFDARKHHEQILEAQRASLDALVDWLAAELITPFARQHTQTLRHASLQAQQELIERMARLTTTFKKLIQDIKDDRLSKPEVATTFANVLKHIQSAHRIRRTATLRAQGTNPKADDRVAAVQKKAIGVLEKDIVYLDDLLALQRIHTLRETAKDLLAAQGDLRSLLEQYRQTQNPRLREQLQRRISEMKDKMLQLIAKMSQIKRQLPGEYRNLEAASMLRVDDQIDRLEKMLRDNDFEGAAAELEQLANMVENMIDSIDNAEQEYGGERYDKLRQQLNEFAQSFGQLEDQQKALAKRTEEMLATYRKQSIQRAGKNLDAFIKKARHKTHQALRQMEKLPRAQQSLPWQSLLDLDALLEHRDFAEARNSAHQAVSGLADDSDRLDRLAGLQRQAPGVQDRQRATDQALQRTREVAAMLDGLFPHAKDIMTPKQRQQMQRMQQKQARLKKEAQTLGQKMDALVQELPALGGAAAKSLQLAEGEMGHAAGGIEGGDLPSAAGHARRAADELGKMRQSLKKASKGKGGKGLPMPLGGDAGQGRPGQHGRPNSQSDVAIPKADPHHLGPKFREELLEAAKQKAPPAFKDAVQDYYKELVR